MVETLHGRVAEKQSLLRWCETDPTIPAAALITGPGGSGKTRLAAEVCSELRSRGWAAGFLGPTDDLVDMQSSAKGLLLVLDYPEEQPGRPAALFAKMAELDKTPAPLRVMLLSRRPAAEWEREATILGARFGQHEVAASQPLESPAAIALIKEAACRFALKANKPVPELGAASEWLEQSALHRLPLYVTAAAVHAVLSPGEAFGLAGAALLEKLALRERVRAERISRANGFGSEGLPRLLALGVLGDGLNSSAIQALAGAGVCPGATTADVLGEIAGTSWWRAGRLERLQPDPMAAPFLAAVLFDRFPEGRPEYADWFFLALEERASAFGERLGRVVFDLDLSASGSRRQATAALNGCLARMLSLHPERADAFAQVAHSSATIWSADFAAQVASILAERSIDDAERVVHQGNRSVFLFYLGRREEALAAGEEAVQLDRKLAQARPEVFSPNLAMSLNNLANQLSAVGRLEEAVAAGEESVQLRRKLAQTRPEAFTPDLATSLGNLASHLSGLGRREEALAAGEEAMQLRRKLAQTRPEAFTPDLATSLNNLANQLSDLGRREEALAAGEEAVQLRRKLAQTRPEAFTPNLATSLANLANHLSGLGRREEALVADKEAVQLRRKLAQARPEAFTPDLATSLANLAEQLSAVGRLEEALAAGEEAVQFNRKLAQARPEAFTPALAMSLANLANHLSGLGRLEEALAAGEEAVQFNRKLTKARREAFTPDLATSCGAFGSALMKAGKPEQAAAAFLEGATVLRPFAFRLPPAFGSLLENLLRDFMQAAEASGMSEEERNRSFASAGVSPEPLVVQLLHAWIEAHNAGETAQATELYAALVVTLDAAAEDADLDPLRDHVDAALAQLGDPPPYGPPPQRRNHPSPPAA